MRFNLKPLLLIPLLSIFLLSACNFPSTMVTVTPNIDRLSTAVSSTLTAVPVLPTSISAPQNTSTNTPAPTNSPSPTAAGTPTSTFTATPESYKKSLGTPTWQNHLDDGKTFGIGPAGYQDDNTKIYVANGAMTLTSNSSVGFRSWRLAAPAPQNFYLEGVFKSLSCGSTDQYGLVYRAPDYSSGFGYYFGITCTGNYTLYKWSASGPAVVLAGSSPFINQGSNQVNTIGVKAVGNDFTFFMNDKVIHMNDQVTGTITDNNLPAPGHFGVFVGAYSGNLSVSLDDIAYWELH